MYTFTFCFSLYALHSINIVETPTLSVYKKFEGTSSISFSFITRKQFFTMGRVVEDFLNHFTLSILYQIRGT